MGVAAVVDEVGGVMGEGEGEAATAEDVVRAVAKVGHRQHTFDRHIQSSVACRPFGIE